MATDRGLVGLGNAGEPYDDFGQGRHYESLNPAGFDPARAREGARQRGHRHQRDVPGPRASSSARSSTRSSRCGRAASTTTGWPSGARPQPERLVGVGALPMQDPVAAARGGAPHQATSGSSAGSPGPNAYNDRPLPPQGRTRRCGRRSRRPASRSRCTPPGSPTCPARRATLGYLMAPGHAPRADPAVRRADDAVEPRVRRRARAPSGPEGRRARVRRRLDRPLDGPHERVPRELPLGRGPDLARAERVLPAAVLDQLRPGRADRRRARAALRRRPLHLGVRLPAQRREVPRRRRRAARAQRRPSRRRPAPASTGATRSTSTA